MTEPDPVALAVESALTPSLAEAAAEVDAWAMATAERAAGGWNFTAFGLAPSFPVLRLRSLRVLVEHAYATGAPCDGERCENGGAAHCHKCAEVDADELLKGRDRLRAELAEERRHPARQGRSCDPDAARPAGRRTVHGSRGGLGGAVGDLEIAAFVAAGLDEDEAAAEAATPGRWVVGGFPGAEYLPCDFVHAPDYRPEGFSEGQHVGDASVADGGMGPWAVSVRGSGFPRANATHIARHDPAAVLRDVAAKRAILRDYETTVRLRDEAAARIKDAGDHPDPADLREWTQASREAEVLAGVVRQLASAWDGAPMAGSRPV